MPAELPRPAGARPLPQRAEELVVVLPAKRGKRPTPPRYRDIEQRPERLSPEAIERGRPHLHVDNPAIWSGSIGPDEDED